MFEAPEQGGTIRIIVSLLSCQFSLVPIFEQAFSHVPFVKPFAPILIRLKAQIVMCGDLTKVDQSASRGW